MKTIATMVRDTLMLAVLAAMLVAPFAAIVPSAQGAAPVSGKLACFVTGIGCGSGPTVLSVFAAL